MGNKTPAATGSLVDVAREKAKELVHVGATFGDEKKANLSLLERLPNDVLLTTMATLLDPREMMRLKRQSQTLKNVMDKPLRLPVLTLDVSSREWLSNDKDSLRLNRLCESVETSAIVLDSIFLRGQIKYSRHSDEKMESKRVLDADWRLRNTSRVTSLTVQVEEPMWPWDEAESSYNLRRSVLFSQLRTLVYRHGFLRALDNARESGGRLPSTRSIKTVTSAFHYHERGSYTDVHPNEMDNRESSPLETLSLEPIMWNHLLPLGEALALREVQLGSLEFVLFNHPTEPPTPLEKVLTQWKSLVKKRLHTLHLGFAPFADAGWKANSTTIAALLASLPGKHLVDLQLQGALLDAERLDLSALPHLTTLRLLDLRWRNFPHRLVDQLTQLSLKRVSLGILVDPSVDKTTTVSTWLRAFAEAKSSKWPNTLEFFELRRFDIDKNPHPDLAPSSEWKRLRDHLPKLRFCSGGVHCRSGDIDAVSLVQWPLYLEVSGEGRDDLAKWLKQQETLRRLTLADDRLFGAAVWAALPQSLEHLTLDASNNIVLEADDVKIIATRCKWLISLKMRNGVHIRSCGLVMYLIGAIATLQRLDCNVEENGRWTGDDDRLRHAVDHEIERRHRLLNVGIYNYSSYGHHLIREGPISYAMARPYGWL